MSLAELDLSPQPRGLGKRGEPVWDLALLYPVQGEWSEEEYLALESNSENRLIELVNGFIEVLPMPEPLHQGISRLLFRKLDDFTTERRKGEVFYAPLPVRLWQNQMREPDILFVKPQRIKHRRRPPEGADLAIEIVSPGAENRERDLQTKRREYAKAKIPEYWIVDPETEQITVLVLNGKAYKIHGVFQRGDQATSKLLPGFSVDVAAVFDAGAGR